MARPTDEENRLRRSSAHVEDQTIEQLADVAAHTDDVAVRRTLFGPRELISTLIPIALLVIAARNVDWSEAAQALGKANPYFVILALVVNYMTFRCARGAGRASCGREDTTSPGAIS